MRSQITHRASDFVGLQEGEHFKSEEERCMSNAAGASA
jgi:hypothetical protein